MTGPHRRCLRVLVAVVFLAATASALPAGAAPVAPASQPAQPTRGPGSDGPCGSSSRTLANPREAARTVWVFQPTGRGHTPLVGGRCDARLRPTVVIAHGNGATDPSYYPDLVRHLVSLGNVVVYPTYTVDSSDRAELEESYRVVEAGLDAAMRATPRADRTRIGVWGHSHGGGMVPYLAQRVGARGWGRAALWLSVVSPAYTQLVGSGAIAVPRHAHALTVAFEHDQLADNRLGIDVFGSLRLPVARKRYVLVSSDPHGQPPLVAEHNTPFSSEDGSDTFDHLLWRYSDLLEGCALRRLGCAADLSPVGTWSDGTPVVPALESRHPVDTGPYPALLAECDMVWGPQLNPRIARCGPTHL